MQLKMFHEALRGIFSTHDVEVSANTRAFHDSCFVFDLHNDFLMYQYLMHVDLSIRHRPPRWFNPLFTQTDIPRLRDGGVNAVGMGTVAIHRIGRGGEKMLAHTHRLLDRRDQMLDRYEDDLELARRAGDLDRIVHEGKIALLTELEGAHLLGDDRRGVEGLYERGVRMITMAHFLTNRFAASSYHEGDGAKAGGASDAGDRLTDLGYGLIEDMERLGIILDLAHTPKNTFLQAAAASTNPFVVSHTALAGIHPLWRNIDDDCIHATAERDGVIAIMVAPYFLAPYYSAPIERVIDHIEYIIDLVGARHAAIGSDLDGFIPTVDGFCDVADFVKFTQLLFDRGHSQAAVRGILGENAKRVFDRVC